MYEIFAQLLEQRNLKAADVCRGTGLPSSLFSEWKRGKSTPKADKMKKIADFFGVSVEYLMTGEEKYFDKDSFELKCNGSVGFQSILADIYGACELEGVMGKFGGECLYFSLGIGKNRYALTENDYDRLYTSVKKTIRQMTDLLIRDEIIVRHECKKSADIPPSIEEYTNMRDKGMIIEELEELYGFTLTLNAAHERTDIEPTLEGQAHDDAIMNDDKEWE